MLTEIKNYLIKTHNPLIIIVHGSFANNSYDDLSDIDVLCFADVQEEIFDCNIIKKYPLDCLIKPLKELNKPENYLYINNYLILIDFEDKGLNFVKEINLLKTNSPILTTNEKEHLIYWINKMIKRSEINSTDGNYRYIWLLYDFLELYCKFNNIFYNGPKKTIKYLAENDIEIFNQYDELLKENKNTEKLKNLYDNLIFKLFNKMNG